MIKLWCRMCCNMTWWRSRVTVLTASGCKYKGGYFKTKMSAPIVSRLSQKDLINSLTRTHLLLSFLILIFTITSVTRDNFLSIVKYRLFVTKLIVAFIAVANVVYQNYFLPTAGTSKLTGISLKVSKWKTETYWLFCGTLLERNFHI